MISYDFQCFPMISRDLILASASGWNWQWAVRVASSVQHGAAKMAGAAQTLHVCSLLAYV